MEPLGGGQVWVPVEGLVVQQGLECDPCLHARKGRSEAEVDSSSEGDLAPRLAVDLELVGVGKRALVTGSSAGIGFGLARALAEAGCQVIMNGRDPAKLRDAAATLRGEGLKIVEAVPAASALSINAESHEPAVIARLRVPGQAAAASSKVLESRRCVIGWRCLAVRG